MARTEKAGNLEALARIVPVPPFTVVDGGSQPTGVPGGEADRYLIRGCMVGEDSATSSRAGASPTVGPVPPRDVAHTVDRLLAMPEVMRLYHVAGANDFLIHVGVTDSEALRELAMNSLTTRPEVAHIETGLIFECVEGPGDVDLS